QYCGESAPHVELQVDHVIPVAEGGKTVKNNLITACRDCNAGKSKSMLDAYVPIPDGGLRGWTIVEAALAFEEFMRLMEELDDEELVLLRQATEAYASYVELIGLQPIPPHEFLREGFWKRWVPVGGTLPL